MVEVVGLVRLRFRRHLAMCLLVALLNEISIDLLGAGVGEILTCGRSWTCRDLARRAHSLRAVRVRLASAHEMPASSREATGITQNIYQYDTYEDLNFFARLLTRLQDSLPVIDLNISLAHGRARNRFEFGQMDAEIDDYYNERFSANMSLEQLQLMSVKAALRTAPIPLHTSWGYETRELMRQGSLPVRDDHLCASQLAHLAQRLDSALREGQASDNRDQQHQERNSSTLAESSESRQVYKTSDLELMRYLDTFGRAPADLLRGNVRWYGSRQGCLRTRLRPSQDSERQAALAGGPQRSRAIIKFRYCLGAYRSLGWPRVRASQLGGAQEPGMGVAENGSRWIDYGVSSTDFNLGNVFLRVGVCLPEACDSSAIARPENLRAIEKLMRFNLAKPFDSDHYQLADLYCQPDSRSPLRSVRLAGKLLLLPVAIVWLSLILAATFVHLNVEKFYAKSVELNDRQRRSFNSSGSREEREKFEQSAKSELKETDILNRKTKLNWIKLNISFRERMRHVVEGVDLIDCLSLYSNWLKYTRRVRLAIVRAHEEDQQHERRRLNGLTKGVTGPLAKPQRSLNGMLSERIECGKTMTSVSNLGAETNRAREEPTLAADGGNHLRSPQRSADQTIRYGANHRVVDTNSLNALKVIALIWIIAGHCIFYLGSAIANGALLTDYLSTVPAFALSNGAIYITELFFVISGCLTAHLVFKRTTRVGVSAWARTHEQWEEEEEEEELSERAPAAADNETTGAASRPRRRGREPDASCMMEPHLFRAPFWLLLAVNRYLRIVPTYLLAYAYVKLVSVYVGGQGQLWDYAVSANSMRRACLQESWLPVLTLTTNYVDIYKHCILGGWYLSADMQFSLIAIPLLWLLAHCQRVRVPSTRPSGQGATGPSQSVARANKRVLAGYSLILATALASLLVSIAATVFHSPIDMSYIIKFSPHTIAILSQNIAMYTNPVFRFRAYALGLILGHLLYLYEFRLIKLPEFIRVHGAALAMAILSCGFCVIFAPVLYPPGKLIASHDMTATLVILSATAIDLLLCALIFLICIGKAPILALFLLNSPFWALLSSLSLCAFLVHTEVIVLLTSLLDPPPSVGYSLLFLVFCAVLLLTYTLALALHLTFEMPVSRLIEASMGSCSTCFMNEQIKNIGTQRAAGA